MVFEKRWGLATFLEFCLAACVRVCGRAMRWDFALQDGSGGCHYRPTSAVRRAETQVVAVAGVEAEGGIRS